MSDAATLAEAPSSSVDRSFLIRRLHSLTGVLPIGLFMCFHLFENLKAVRGPAAYNEAIESLNTLMPSSYFHVVEVLFIFVPILFHALYGFYVASTGRPNVARYAYATNWSWWFQRITGIAAFLFLLVHVGTLRVVVTQLGKHLSPFVPEVGKLDIVRFSDVAVHLGNTNYAPVTDTWLAGGLMFWGYLLGVLACIYHFTNGLVGFAWTWGLAVGRVSLKRVQLLGWAIFLALSVMSLNTLYVLRFGH